MRSPWSLLGIGWLLMAALASCPATAGSQQLCPPGCFCTSAKRPPMPANLPSGTKVNCRSLKSGNGPDFARMPNDTVSLDLSNYGLSEVRKYMFSGLPYLQRLFLQGNGIKVIEDHSFRTLGHLQYIDLSRYVTWRHYIS